MRKLLHIILSILLLISTSGIIGSRHLCGDRLISIELFHAESTEDCCAADEDPCCNEVPVDCCDDNLVEISALQVNVTTPGVLSVLQPKAVESQLTYNVPEFSNSLAHNIQIYPSADKAEKEQHKRQTEFGCFLI